MVVKFTGQMSKKITIFAQYLRKNQNYTVIKKIPDIIKKVPVILEIDKFSLKNIHPNIKEKTIPVLFIAIT